MRYGPEWQDALILLAAMGKAAVEPSIITYSSAVGACKIDAEWKMTLDLLTEIGPAIVEANAITHSLANRRHQETE